MVIALLTWGVLGCKKTQPVVDIPQLVKSVEVSDWGKNASATYPGKLKATENIKLAFRVAGPIKRIHVQEGQQVKKGQLLAELDARDYQLQYDASQAEYSQVKEETERIIELYRRGSVSVNEYDKAIAARKRVTALYQANQNALNDTRLKAPFDGYIQNKYFSASEIVNQGTPVLSMMNTRQLEVEVDIPVQDFIRREDFADCYAVADAFPDVRLPLELEDIDRGANYNQLFRARFRLKQDTLKNLAPGMSVSVTIHFRSDNRTIVTVPISALFQQDGKSYVWLYDEQNQTVRRLNVQIQQIRKDGTVWVQSALRQGQKVISAGVNDLKEGQRVKLLPPPSTSNVGQLL